MAGWMARAGGVVLFLLLSVFALEPLARAGFSALDLRTLADVGSALGAPSFADTLERLHVVAGAEGHPLAGLSLLLSNTLWSRDGAWTGVSALPLRVENLLLAWVAAAGLGLFLRRLLIPWLGSEAAEAAGRAAALFFALHPAILPAATCVSARGDLLALALGLPAAELLLRGRQERRPVLGLVAGVLAVLAGFASDLALALPLLLSIAEFTSARRWRPERVRWRTALTTLLAFAACVSLQVIARSALHGRLEILGAGSRLAGPGYAAGALSEFLRGLERVGVMLLPVPTAVTGPVGFALAGAMFLLVLHPGLQAARSAPRLWGWLVLGWLGAIMLCEALSPGARVTNADLSRADTLLASVAVVAAGLGTAATALSGGARVWLPWFAALCLAVFAHALSLASRDASAEVEHLRTDLEAARERFGRDALLIVIDPPGLVRGVDALSGEIQALLDPRVTGRASDPREARARGLTFPAFLALCREAEFTALRSDPTVVSLPSAAIEPGGTGRLAVLLPKPRSSERVRSWQHEGRSPPLDLEALTERVLRVRDSADADTGRAPEMHWRASVLLDRLRDGSLRGVWRAGGEHADEPLALFDLSSSLAWLLGDRILQIFPTEGFGLGLIVDAEVAQHMPEPAPDLAPRDAGQGDWIFPAPPGGFPRDEQARERWFVGLLDLASWRYVEVPCVSQPDGGLSVPGAARVAAAWLQGGGGPVAWSLEGRIDGVTVWRSSGRRIAAESR